MVKLLVIKDERIDGGRAFDWGRASADYARFRDIYPDEFYRKIAARGLCVKGQRVLDLGTGTGVLPRNMYSFGAGWTGTDISENQIAQAKILSEGMDIDYYVMSAEELNFPDNTFDVITACQCFWYFDHERIMPKLFRMLKPGGKILVLYLAWLPFEEPPCYYDKFELVYSEEYHLKVHFTREGWNGRMKACRGVGASLPEDEIRLWEKAHKELLEKIAPEEFDILHYAAAAELKRKG